MLAACVASSWELSFELTRNPNTNLKLPKK
jgi:hypothetical protein